MSNEIERHYLDDPTFDKAEDDTERNWVRVIILTIIGAALILGLLYRGLAQERMSTWVYGEPSSHDFTDGPLNIRMQYFRDGMSGTEQVATCKIEQHVVKDCTLEKGHTIDQVVGILVNNIYQAERRWNK